MERGITTNRRGPGQPWDWYWNSAAAFSPEMCR
jgi:hypothetical protein